MVPGSKPRYWEWVSAKAGILMHGSEKPTRASGANLFGNFTWNKSWKHGYEPMATLDLNGDSLLTGSELKDIWVWVDANTDAILAPDEVSQAEGVFDALSVRPLGADDAHVPKGARLRNGGDWVGSWDWWSGSFYQSDTSPLAPLCDPAAPVTLYRWRQTHDGIKPLAENHRDAMGGYFHFVEVAGHPVIVSVSSKSPVKLMAACSKAVVRGDEGGSTRVLWSFGDLISGATIQSNGTLMGSSFFVPGKPVFQWVAEPVASFDDPLAASLASVSPLVVEDHVSDGKFNFRPVVNERVEWPGFLPLSDFLNRLKSNGFSESLR